MNSIRREEALQRLRRREADWRALGVLHMDLFGSVARDDGGEDANANADVDVVVEFGPRASYDQLFQLRELLQQVLGRPVDIVTRNGAARHPRLMQRIERDSIRVA